MFSKLLAKHASSLMVSKLLAPLVDRALPPSLLEQHAVAPQQPAAAAASPQVLKAVKNHELAPEQLDHLLNRIQYDKKYKDLAQELHDMRESTKSARPFSR